jgi:hypothetical protein
MIDSEEREEEGEEVGQGEREKGRKKEKTKKKGGYENQTDEEKKYLFGFSYIHLLLHPLLSSTSLNFQRNGLFLLISLSLLLIPLLIFLLLSPFFLLPLSISPLSPLTSFPPLHTQQKERIRRG